MSRFSRDGIRVTHLSWSSVTWFIILVITFIYLFTVRLKDDNWKNVVEADGHGYYAYLPAAFIYGDMQYAFAPKRLCEYQNHCAENYPYFCTQSDGKYVNKYFVGVSVAVSPFWLPMSLVSGWSGYKHDGYSFLFFVSVSLAGLFYAMAGLWVLRKLLRRFGIEDHLIAVLLPLLYFGTNLFHYAVNEPSMSHIYSFAFVTFFLWQWCKLVDVYSRKRLVWIGLLLGMILIIRPTNILIVLLIPFLCGSWENTKTLFLQILRDWKSMLTLFLSFALPVFLQLLMYKLQAGTWWVYSYSKEGFDFTNPEIMNVLFSYRRGLFVYTPLLAVFIFGIILLRRNRFQLLFMALFLVVTTYVISSWWMWFYGGCYGMRPYVDYYAVYALLGGLLLQALYTKTKHAWKIGALLALPFIYVSLFQTWQYRESIIAYDFMDKYKFWRVFMQGGQQFKYIYMPGAPVPPDVPANTKRIFYHKLDFEKPDSVLELRDRFVKAPGYNSSTGTIIGTQKQESPGYSLVLPKYIPDSLNGKLWVRVRAQFNQDNNTNDAVFVTTLHPVQGNVFFWESPWLIWKNDTKNTWKQLSYAYKLPAWQNPDDRLSIYILKRDHSKITIDDMELELFAEQP